MLNYKILTILSIALIVALSCVSQQTDEKSQDQDDVVVSYVKSANAPVVVDKATGKLAKDFDLALFNGQTLRLSELKGQVIVLNFWTPSCPTCRAEIPILENMWQEYKDKGVTFVGISGIIDSEKHAKTFIENNGVTYHVGRDETGEIAQNYRALTLPTTFIIDRNGNEARKLGTLNAGMLRIFINGQLQN